MRKRPIAYVLGLMLMVRVGPVVAAVEQGQDTNGEVVRAFSYAGEGVTASALQDLVREKLGATLVFVPKKPDDRFQVDLHDVSAADLLQGLSKVGAAALVQPGRGATPVHVSLRAQNVPEGTFAALLRQVFGDAVSVQTAAPNSLVSLELENATLQDLQEVLPKVTGIRVRNAAAN